MTFLVGRGVHVHVRGVDAHGGRRHPPRPLHYEQHQDGDFRYRDPSIECVDLSCSPSCKRDVAHQPVTSARQRGRVNTKEHFNQTINRKREASE